MFFVGKTAWCMFKSWEKYVEGNGYPKIYALILVNDIIKILIIVMKWDICPGGYN